MAQLRNFMSSYEGASGSVVRRADHREGAGPTPQADRERYGYDDDKVTGPQLPAAGFESVSASAPESSSDAVGTEGRA